MLYVYLLSSKIEHFNEHNQGVDPYGTMGTCPQYLLRGGAFMVMSPPIFWGLVCLLTATTVVCCILMQILCVAINFIFYDLAKTKHESTTQNI